MNKFVSLTGAAAFVAVAGIVNVHAADGQQVYQQACFACHGTGAAGAPKLGDKANWAPRIKQGMKVLSEHAIKGYQGKSGVMPPKGGRTDLSDDDVKAAVTYMVDQSK